MKGFWASQRDRISQWGLLRTLGYYVFGVAADKVGVKIWDAFEYPKNSRSHPPSSDVTFSIVGSMDDWTARDLELLRTHEGLSLLALYQGFFAEGDQCAVARVEGVELACVCWIHARSDYQFAESAPSFLIQYCFTLPAHRGQGYYASTLVYACWHLRCIKGPITRIFVDCSVFNFASKRGILNAGFRPVGWIFKAFSHTWAVARYGSKGFGMPDVVSNS